jgi:hypothetical protein
MEQTKGKANGKIIDNHNIESAKSCDAVNSGMELNFPP